MVTGTLSTSTFINVVLTGGDGGASLPPPAAPFSVLAAGSDGQVVLRWNPSFGASSYNVLRSSMRGGSYSMIASGVKNTAYIDTTAQNGTTYYYVVMATTPPAPAPPLRRARPLPAPPPSTSPSAARRRPVPPVPRARRPPKPSIRTPGRNGLAVPAPVCRSGSNTISAPASRRS